MDINGDGLDDIISGSGSGAFLFLRNQDGTFSAGEKFLDPNFGRPGIDPMYDPFESPRDPGIWSTIVPYAVDWDRDGDLDILLGDRGGSVYYFSNQSGSTELQFSLPVKIEADGSPVEAFHGYASPYVTDWDGDGSHDLLLGCSAGNVFFYRNKTAKGLPVLEAPVELVPVSGSVAVDHSYYDPDQDRGTHAVVSIADWNGDGLSDLLLGSHRRFEGKKPDLTLPERATLDRLWAEYDVCRRKYLSLALETHDRAQRKLRLSDEEFAELRGPDLLAYYEVLDEVRSRTPIQKRLDELGEVWNKMQPYMSKDTYHGWVWVYLRNPGGSKE